jgi:hypothetical protein
MQHRSREKSAFSVPTDPSSAPRESDTYRGNCRRRAWRSAVRDGKTKPGLNFAGKRLQLLLRCGGPCRTAREVVGDVAASCRRAHSCNTQIPCSESVAPKVECKLGTPRCSSSQRNRNANFIQHSAGREGAEIRNRWSSRRWLYSVGKSESSTRTSFWNSGAVTK